MAFGAPPQGSGQLMNISVNLLSANVRAADANGLSDPFVVIGVYRNNQPIGQHTSPYVQKTLNPAWQNVSYSFNQLHPQDLIKIWVMDHDGEEFNPSGRKQDDFLGHLVFPVQNILHCLTGQPMRFNFQNCPPNQGITLSFNQGLAARPMSLNLFVQSANVRAADSNGLSDPFVVCQMCRGQQVLQQQQTNFIPKTLTPSWNKNLAFNAVLPTDVLKLWVMDYDGNDYAPKNDDFLGYLELPVNTLLQKNGQSQSYPFPKSNQHGITLTASAR